MMYRTAVCCALFWVVALLAGESPKQSVWLYALGRITSVQHAESGEWHVGFGTVEVLLEESDDGFVIPRTAETRVREGMGVTFTTGLGGIWVDPGPQWVGRLALFTVRASEGRYRIGYHLGISPHMSGFAVLSPDEESCAPLIRKAAGMLAIVEVGKRCDALAGFVAADGAPLFLQRFAMRQLALIGSLDVSDDQTTSRWVRAKLLGWRGQVSLGPDLQLAADTSLAYCSPNSYTWESSRLAFLRELRDREGLAPETIAQVAGRLARAERTGDR